MTPSTTHDRRFVLWLSVAQLITWGGIFYGFSLLMEPVERELGLTRAQSSLAFSLALFAEGAAAFPFGRWIDQGHERLVMTACSVLAGVCLVAHSFIHSQAEFYAVWILLGVALGGTLYTPVFAVVTRRFPHDFRRAIITLTFLGGLASTVMIPVFAWLISDMGWRQALWVLAALQLFVCAPLHYVQLRGAPAPAPRAQARPPAEHMRSAPYILIGVFTLCMMAVTAAMPPHFISLLRGTGIDEKWVIAIPASLGIIQVIGRLMMFFFEHRFDIHATNRTIPMLMPVALVILIFTAGSAWGAIVFVTLFGLGNGMMTIVKGTAIAQYVSRDNIGALNGALGPPTAVARSITPWLVGALWSVQAGYTIGLWVLVAIAVLGCTALVMAQRIALARSRGDTVTS